MKERILEGHSASSGAGLGRVVLLPSLERFVPHRTIPADGRPAEQDRFERALAGSIRQLEELTARSALAHEYRLIFEAQLLFFRDPLILGDVAERIAAGLNAEGAVVDSLEAFKHKLSVLDNQLIRERASDLDDVENRILSNLMEIPEGDVRVPLLRDLPRDAVLVADDISPSLMLHVRHAAGIAVERGGVTGHMAILARSRGIPAVVGVTGLLERVRADMPVLVEADRGLVVLAPEPGRVLALEQARSTGGVDVEASLVLDRFELSDGSVAELWVNADEPEDLSDPRVRRSFGVGLFRTEFLYLNQPGLFFLEDEQRDIYVDIMRRAEGRRVTIRVLDLGDDKTVGTSFYNVVNLHQESLKSLRGIQFLLANPTLLRSQLQAVLSAYSHVRPPSGSVRLMVPMVTGLDQLLRFQEFYCAAAEANGVDPAEIEVGTMLETPAACLMADVLERASDFFSLGTNDLAACLFARDRVQSLAREDSLYQPALYRMVLDVVRRSTLPLSVCGEVATVPGLLYLLLGLGVRSFSVARSSLATVSNTLRSVDLDRAEDAARLALEAPGEAELRRTIQEVTGDHATV